MGVKHLVGAYAVEGFGGAMERYFYLELAYWADREGIIRISQIEVASRCLVSPRTAARQFQVLSDKGFIKCLQHGRYALHFPEKGVVPKHTHEEGDAELRRLQALMKPDQYIAFTSQGWPVLQGE